eukprot:13263499-Heterocapsa_arctica.AAC.1
MEETEARCLSCLLWPLLNWDCVDFDIFNAKPGHSEDHDLTSDSLWERLLRDIKSGEIDAVWFGTPCTTFSKARELPGGPRPLRDRLHPYGFPKVVSHCSGIRG